MFKDALFSLLTIRLLYFFFSASSRKVGGLPITVIRTESIRVLQTVPREGEPVCLKVVHEPFFLHP